MLRINVALLALFVVAWARTEYEDLTDIGYVDYTEITTRLPEEPSTSAGELYEDKVQEVEDNSISTSTPHYNLDEIVTAFRMVKCALPDQGPKRNDYQYTPGVGAHKLHTKPVTWNEARHICHTEGAHLAIVNSEEEANVLKNLLGNGRVFQSPEWATIGFHDFYKEGEYVTILDESLEDAGYMSWRSGEPNNWYGNEDCGAIDNNGLLLDMTCEAPNAFICELFK